MKIQPALDPAACPTTRKALLYHLWGVGLANVNIAREGAFYAATIGTRIYATHARRIGHWSFAQWEEKFRQAYFGA